MPQNDKKILIKIPKNNIFLLFSGDCHCYFRPEWIGQYLLQIPPSNAESLDAQTLSKIEIEDDNIPILGECYSNNKNGNYLLIER